MRKVKLVEVFHSGYECNGDTRSKTFNTIESAILDTLNYRVFDTLTDDCSDAYSEKLAKKIENKTLSLEDFSNIVNEWIYDDSTEDCDDYYEREFSIVKNGEIQEVFDDDDIKSAYDLWISGEECNSDDEMEEDED